MLGALTQNQAITKTGKHKITLGFARAEERNKALWNQVLNTPKREFFGFNNRTEKIINKTFNNIYNEVGKNKTEYLIMESSCFDNTGIPILTPKFIYCWDF